jgi:hypothetical protein
MTTRISVPLALLLLAVTAAWPDSALAQPGASAPQTVETVRQAARADKRGLVEKNMKLTPDEAKRFWPLYDEHQRKLDAITKRQNRVVLDYVNTEDSMTDANAKRLVKEFMEADADEQRLRERTVKAMMAALPAKKAARYMQIENKIRTLNRYDIAERIPLVH